MATNILNKFHYEHKSSLVSFADLVLLPSRVLFNGKAVHCKKIHSSKATFIGPEETSYSPLYNIPIKTIAIAGLAASLPLLPLATSIKTLDNLDQYTAKRWKKRSQKDRFKIANPLHYRLMTRLFYWAVCRFSGYNKFVSSMGLLGDNVFFSVFSRNNVHPALSIPTASDLIDRLKKTEENAEPPIAESCKVGRKAMKIFLKNAIKMLPIKAANHKPLKWMINQEKEMKLLAKDFSQQISQMKPGEVFLFPTSSGLNGKEWSRYVSSFECQPDSTFSWNFYVVNAETIREFSLTLPHKDERDVTKVSLIRLKREDLTNEIFLKEMIHRCVKKESNLIAFAKEFERKHRSVSFLFSPLFRKNRKNPFSETLHSLNFALKDKMGTKSYKLFKFAAKIDSLRHIEKKNPKKDLSLHKVVSKAKVSTLKRYTKIKSLFNEDSLKRNLREKTYKYLKKISSRS